MATIETRTSKSGAVSYRAKVRHKGCRSLSASFPRKTDAKKWATQVESDLLQGKHFKYSKSKQHTLHDAIDLYGEEIFDQLKDPYTRINHLKFWAKMFGDMSLADIQATHIRNERVKLRNQCSDSTANRYVASLSALFSFTCKELEWLEDNPCLRIKRLKEPEGRIRMLSHEERNKLILACEQCKKYPQMTPIVLLAITTGMRRGEILNLKWTDIDFVAQRIVLRYTKNGEVRSVPLVGPAFDALQLWAKVRSIDNGALVFPSQVEGNSITPFHLYHAWSLIKRDAGLENFRFHDLRHTAASYLVMNGAGLREIGDILGHKTLAMVQRYSHITDDHKHETVSRMVTHIFGEST
jgi:integrase